MAEDSQNNRRTGVCCERGNQLNEVPIARRMREEWDRRVSHDYRYWMSDGVSDDELMWRSGERDFEHLIEGLDRQLLKQWRALELGCGVGRLVRAASSIFRDAVGVDVSAAAISEARRLLQGRQNVTLMLGNGVDLQPLRDSSFDFAYTFAALSSMPVAVIAGYLSELSRVLKRGAIARLQIYLGRAQMTAAEDTLAIRSFEYERFADGAAKAGFDVQWAKELILPFQISDYDSGTVASIVSLSRSDRPALEPEEIAAALLPNGEESAGDEWSGSRTAYLMAVARANQHLENGEAERALRALEFAVANYREAEQDVLDVLAKLRQLDPAAQSAHRDSLQPAAMIGEAAPADEFVSLPSSKARLGELFRSDLLEKNMTALRERFPRVAVQLSKVRISADVAAARSSAGDAVLTVRGFPLSHAEKPARSGEVWAERVLNSKILRDKDSVLVVGFADAYHLRALAAQTERRIFVAEPRLDVMLAAFCALDCSDIIQRISGIASTKEEIAELTRTAFNAEQCEIVIHPQTQTFAGDFIVEARRAFYSARGIGKLRPSIGVVSPLYGGSLPIARYAHHALSTLNQRVFDFDLAGFYKPFSELPRFLRSKARLGVVESQYVEMLSQLVLESTNERPIDILICLAQAPMSPRVLTELRSRGVITVMWFVEDCRRFTTWREIAPYYDYMFLIQRDQFPQLVQQAGAGRAIYLPVGCAPWIHRPLELTEEERKKFGSEISFVGAGYNNRRHVFSTLADRDFKIWGTEWPACLPFTRLVQDQGSRVAVEDYVKVFNASTININLHSSSERDGVEPFGDFVNPRTFELASTGAFQLVDNRTLLGEKFDIGKEIAVFNNEKELHERIDYYLARPEERAAIIEASRKRAHREHTYQQRLQTMLEYIYADRYDHLSSRVQQSPWPKTLNAAENYPELKTRLNAIYERGEEPKLEGLVRDIHLQKGALSETEQKILFLHHVGSQISHVKTLRKEE